MELVTSINSHSLAVMLLTVFALFLFTREKVPLETSSLFILVALTVGFTVFPYTYENTTIHAIDFFSGFGHEALIAVCALMIAGQGLVRTGALEPVGRVLSKLWGSYPKLSLLLTLVVGATLSAFVNNVPIVILLLPILTAVSIRTKTSASKVLMPMGFATLIGGMSTTIGTSTNLLVVSVAVDMGLKSFGMFDFFLPVVITDVERQKPNVFRMRLLGAKVVPVTSGRGTLKDAMNEALRDWVTNVRDTFYCIGTVAGPHPYPAMVRDFQSIIGKEAREQILAREGRLPDTLVACIGGGSNAMGLFHPFLDDPDVRIIGVEAGGHGVDDRMEHAASLTGGRPGVLHGNRTYLLQDADGQIIEGHSISAGLDYPGIGPEHSWLHDIGRVEYVSITDAEALVAFQLSCRTEGIIPALEPAHALAHVTKIAPDLPADHLLVMNMCGRGDKDIFTVAEALGTGI